MKRKATVSFITLSQEQHTISSAIFIGLTSQPQYNVERTAQGYYQKAGVAGGHPGDWVSQQQN